MERIEERCVAWKVGAVLAATALALLQACGGGGGGGADGGTPASSTQAPADSSASPAPTAPSTPAVLASSWLLQSEHELAPSEVQLDASGKVTAGGTTYTFQPGGSTGCTASAPGNPAPDLYCKTLAGGNVYAMCDDLRMSETYAMFLLKHDAVGVVSRSELAGRTLRFSGCTRPSDFAISFAADGKSASMKSFSLQGPDLPTMLPRPYSESELDSLLSADGLRTGTRVERWLLYRVTAPDGTPSYMLIRVARVDVDGRTFSDPMQLFMPV